MLEAISAKNSFESSLESKEALKLLQQYIAEGYLLHGSNNKYDVLKPQQASDDGDKESSTKNMVGVYATDHVEVALARALMHRPDSDFDAYWHWDERKEGEGIDMRLGGRNITLGTGFVHVLSKDSFKEVLEDGARELVSSNEVVPIACVEVQPDILKDLPVSFEGDLEHYFDKNS